LAKESYAELKISEKKFHSAEWFTLEVAEKIDKIGIGTKSLLTDYIKNIRGKNK